MQKKLIGRKKERESLQTALESEQPELVAVVGRRRVGKTFLIKHTYTSHFDFELTGLQHASKSDQLQNFLFALKSFFPDFQVESRPKSWLEAFFLLSNALEEQHKQEKMVVFLDELPWLGTKKSGFITGLSWFWNSWAVNQHIVVVICGSAASWMIDKVINDKGGLHNRVTKLLLLSPFSLEETEAFLRMRNVNLNRYQITQLYMAMGGIPMYLDQVKPGLSAIQNIQEICFDRKGYLRNEFDRLFLSLFDQADNHKEIVKVLAEKRMGMTRQELIDKTRFKNGGMLTQILDELNQSGFIEIYQGYGKKKRMSLYRLIDPYSLFYLTFLKNLGTNSQVDFTKLSDLPNYKSWSGYAFENICFVHIAQIRKALGISGIYTSISSFIARPTEDLPGTQIDLVIDRGDQSVNICEMKFYGSDYEVTKRDIENWETKKRVFRHHTKSKKHLFLSLITSFGVMNNANRLNSVDHVVVLEDLFS